MKNRIGEKYITNEGYEVEIIEYFGKSNCTILIDEMYKLYNIQYCHIKEGSVKNPFHKSVYGIGYFGTGKYKAKIKGRNTNAYSKWNSMLKRCYCKKRLFIYTSYKGCSVHPDWHNFQVFAEWFEQNYNEGFELDKDILFKGNKIYSPETCCFVPKEINLLFLRNSKNRGCLPIGVQKNFKGYIAKCSINSKQISLGTFKTPEKAFKAYKKAKEKEIKSFAKLIKNDIPSKVYQALINYQVEIGD